ncbi:hypothetical protein [Phaeacidiphilus oryzae]|jgi:hypothetical protein|uniref:hypothetical protein n=1 Tax=Phaeacidiphilus oryzae TaxID=348818 RepID=UPI000561F41D|nr:hypothetical protein [Phaeacidiphilus oryzae]
MNRLRTLRGATALSLFTALSGVGLLAAPASHAAGLADLTCSLPSNRVTGFDPPLTLAAQPTHVTLATTYGPCVSLSHPDITSGSTRETVDTTMSCLDLLATGPVGSTITWNTGQTTTWSGTRVTSVEGADIITDLTGTVTSGVFEGDVFEQVQVAPATAILACEAGAGTVSSVNATVTTEITAA